MPLPPSTYAPSVVSHTPTSRSRRTQSATGVALPESVVGSPVSRPPSAANTHRTGSLRRTPSALGTPRVPPSVIGSQRVPPSIAGSGPSRHTPPPESAPSDIAPESESHGGKALRSQARLEGDKMSMAFTASQHQEKMHKLHDEAANQIFKEKNDGRPADEVDLHGLYVKEALSRLSRYLREAPVAGQTTVRVITGKGIHSEGEPQLIPAVEESLRSKGLRHHTDPNNAGVVVVELGPRSPVSD
ncbi:Small MutS-related domain [Rhizoctonia solani]|uniref:Small MutS-related domain n=1 Tax=Rhizoctonia solani TaxID=456999 RepID=A0A8H7LZ81_9AGAM|nr:Small MutS-related domain [Rhizoctonia solani]